MDSFVDDPGKYEDPAAKVIAETRALRKFMRQVSPGRSRRLLTVACFAHRQKKPYFCRAEIEHYMSLLPEREQVTVNQRSLIHMSKVGLIERFKRGVYTVTEAGHAEILNLIETEKQRSKNRLKFDGLEEFLTCFPGSDFTLQVQMTAYFLKRFEAIDYFDEKLLKRSLKGVKSLRMPKDLAPIIKSMTDELGQLERVGRENTYRLSAASYKHLKKRPYVKYAESCLAPDRKPID